MWNCVASQLNCDDCLCCWYEFWNLNWWIPYLTFHLAIDFMNVSVEISQNICRFNKLFISFLQSFIRLLNSAKLMIFLNWWSYYLNEFILALFYWTSVKIAYILVQLVGCWPNCRPLQFAWFDYGKGTNKYAHGSVMMQLWHRAQDFYELV